jgi:hypothetical protein
MRGWRGYRNVLSTDTRTAAILAKTLRAQLENYLGGPAGSVIMFDVELGYEKDVYTQADNPFDAVSYTRTTSGS